MFDNLDITALLLVVLIGLTVAAMCGCCYCLGRLDQIRSQWKEKK